MAARPEPLKSEAETKALLHLRDVHSFTRLTSSSACLVVQDHVFSPVIERALNRGIEGAIAKRILELSPKHDVISKMQMRQAANAEVPFLADGAGVLHGVALVAEGSLLTDAARFDRAAMQNPCQAM